MKKQIRWATLMFSLFGLAGCGLKGPLYFPPTEQPKADQAQSVSQDQSPQANAQTSKDSNSVSISGQ